MITVAVDFFKLVEQHDNRLLDILHQFVEVVTAPGTVDDNGADALLTSVGAQSLGQQALARTFSPASITPVLLGRSMKVFRIRSAWRRVLP